MNGKPWSRKREATDYSRWIAAAPMRYRALLREWVASCPPRGRRFGWKVFVEDDDARAASELVKAALSARQARAELTPFDRLSLG